MATMIRRRQVCVLGSAKPGSAAYALAGEAGRLMAGLGITVVSGCGSPPPAMPPSARWLRAGRPHLGGVPGLVAQAAFAAADRLRRLVRSVVAEPAG